MKNRKKERLSKCRFKQTIRFKWTDEILILDYSGLYNENCDSLSVTTKPDATPFCVLPPQSSTAGRCQLQAAIRAAVLVVNVIRGKVDMPLVVIASIGVSIYGMCVLVILLFLIFYMYCVAVELSV